MRKQTQEPYFELIGVPILEPFGPFASICMEKKPWMMVPKRPPKRSGVHVRICWIPHLIAEAAHFFLLPAPGHPE